MKKLFTVFVTLALVLGLAACGSGKEEEDLSGSVPPEASVQAAEEKSTEGENTEGTQPSSDVQEENGLETDEEPSLGDPEGGEVKALVVYFSATGNTKAVAQTLAGLQEADIYEIVPQEPYSEEDLNYSDSTTRATAEQNDPDARPAIQGGITNFEQYEIVYVGYPIWWGDMPRILYTFFDTYDFSGKTIAPFCTSGGSGLSGTPGTIAELESGATVLEGLAVSGSGADSAQSSVEKWLGDIGQD